MDRVTNVIAKLARGHVAYELTLPRFEEPSNIAFLPLASLSDEQRARFEGAGADETSFLPEIGSRAFLRVLGVQPYHRQPGPWIVVQEGRYRYSVNQNHGETVLMVLSEYLACSVNWE